MTKIKERPIIMGGESVRAIQEERKTQTRRVVFKGGDDDHHMPWRVSGTHWQDGDDELRCPFHVGQTLWVRETWASPGPQIVAYDADAECGAWIGDGDGGSFWNRHGLIHESRNYASGRFPATTYSLAKYGGKWRSPIHMPRWASRLTLEITNVRAQRLQDISEEDAAAEGVIELRPTTCSARDDYRDMWDAINGKKHPWASNPWVWAVTFQLQPRTPS